jgi:hypothetical protein
MRSPEANDGCILPANQSLIRLRSTPIILAMLGPPAVLRIAPLFQIRE